MKKFLIILWFVLLFIPMAQANNAVPITLGQKFTLKKDETAKLADTGLEIEITQFFNTPCPKTVQCVWSGVGVQLLARMNGQTQKGMDALQAFGYITRIITSDHATYADIIVSQTE